MKRLIVQELRDGRFNQRGPRFRFTRWSAGQQCGVGAARNLLDAPIEVLADRLRQHGMRLGEPEAIHERAYKIPRLAPLHDEQHAGARTELTGAERDRIAELERQIASALDERARKRDHRIH